MLTALAHSVCDRITLHCYTHHCTYTYNKISSMATFEGNWQQISKTNEEKILQALGCPDEFISKITGGPNLRFKVERDSEGWVWNAMVKEFSVKIVMHKGQGHAVGAHAPNFKAVPAELSDTVIVEEIVDLSGEKHGQIKYQVNGDDMTCNTTIKDIEGVSLFKRT